MEALARDSFFFRLLSGVFLKISSPRPEKVLQYFRLVSFQKRQDAPYTIRFFVSRFVGMGEIR